ncbi:hypothetical protein QFC22_003830 [Naganishia vaughanmartiniae]|uniref:Uncharacterized protein n=1 Tax=Naganishia vaughanmartiniae TaxID=1424756 RepID=A0ACC2X4U4_9TREE|nr:hypothetical protein QFC22_003830 [Naganishia vaughanmartiniae]
MCSYNLVNSSWACQNSKAVNGLLKHELGFQGQVMSDWQATHSGVDAALAGLDQSMPGDVMLRRNTWSQLGRCPEDERPVFSFSLRSQRLAKCSLLDTLRAILTAEGPLVCIPLFLFQGGCEPSVIQQTVGSDYLKAQNKRELQALVPTVSIYTIQDDIVQSEIINPTSVLPSATSVSVQEICGLTYLADHFTIPYASPAFYMTYLALTEGANNARTKFKLNMCIYFTADTVYANAVQREFPGFANQHALYLPSVPNPFTQATSALRLVFAGGLALAAVAPRVRSEPALRPYVCAAGDAINCSK